MGNRRNPKMEKRYHSHDDDSDYLNLVRTFTNHSVPEAKSQNRYLALLRTVKDWIWEVDANVRITYAGPQVFEILGYRPEELVGTSPFDLMDDKEGKRVEAIFTRVAHDRQPFFAFEQVCRHKDGSPRIIETNAIPVYEADGSFRGYVGTDRDITERRIAERNLIETQQQLENLVSNLPGMAYRYTNDENRAIQFASFGCKELVGYGPDQLTELRQVSFDSLVHPDDRKRIRAEIRDATSQEQPYQLVYRLITADNRVKWVSDKGREIKSKNGNPGILEGFIVDDTDRLQALHSIQANTIHNSKEIKRQLELSESLKNVMSVINSCRFVRETLAYITVESVNLLSADAAICLYSKEEKEIELVTIVNFPQPTRGHCHTLMQWVKEHISPTGNPQVIDLCDQLSTENQPILDYLQENHNLGDNDAFRTCVITSVAINSPPGGAVILFYKRDNQFTPEKLELASLVGKQMELAIESGRLRTLATDAAITEERKRLARELHDSVTQLLCGLTLYSESAWRFLDAENTDRLAECIKQISITTRQALSEMRLLVYELQPETTDMGDMVGVLTRRLQAVETRSGIRTHLDFQVRSKIPDEVQTTLIKVSQEALNNIIKHAQADHVEIRILQNEKNLEMVIRDNGCGFELESAMLNSGIGLRSMVERMKMIGGNLIIESGPGKGTCLQALARLD